MKLVEKKPIDGEIMPHEIVAYDPFRSQLAEMKAVNEKTHFDYEDSKGNKEARSYIYKLRQSRAALEKARKKEKAASLEYGRKVDSEAKEISEAIESMIAVHQKPLDEIEDRERSRIEVIKDRINFFIIRQECSGHSSQEIKENIAEIKEISIDESFAEFELDALKHKELALVAQEKEFDVAIKREAEQAELERLRKEAAEREQKEREERIAREAAEQARKEAEDKAKSEKEAIERKAREEREASERRELELKLAAERAEKEKVQAIEFEKNRIKLEEEKKESERKKREDDKKHTDLVHGEIIEALGNVGVIEPLAHSIITAIKDGRIPHLNINY